VSLEDIPLVVDELCPIDSVFLLNLNGLMFEPPSPTFFVSSAASSPLTADWLHRAWERSQVSHPQTLIVHPHYARRLRAWLERWVRLPADVDGNMRCPTCFRRLRRHWAKYAYRCPSRRCPLHYEITNQQLAARRHTASAS